MIAARFHGAHRPLVLEEVPTPEPGPDEVALAAAGRPLPPVHDVLPLAEVDAAPARLREGEPVGRIVVGP